MFGGGQPAMIGEITLSHHGVLVMDEMHQYRPDILAGLAGVMEAGEVAVRCRGRDLRLPARALVVGTSNLCPCGRTGAVSGGCACTPAAKRAFWTRLSGPLLDRIDLQVEMSDVTASDLAASAVSASGGAPEATSDSPDDPLRQARECVRRARARQEAKFGPGMSNGFADEESFRSKMRVESSARDMLQEAQAVLGLSARAYFRTLRVAATAADLAGRDTVSVDEVAEALAYRSRLRPLT
jgi:magnesium chelatase family protein